jgi:hypothetical protein
MVTSHPVPHVSVFSPSSGVTNYKKYSECQTCKYCDCDGQYIVLLLIVLVHCSYYNKVVHGYVMCLALCIALLQFCVQISAVRTKCIEHLVQHKKEFCASNTERDVSCCLPDNFVIPVFSMYLQERHLQLKFYPNELACPHTTK